MPSVPWNSIGSCGTKLTARRRLASCRDRISRPSISMGPCVGSCSRIASFSSEFFPDPLSPTMATRSGTDLHVDVVKHWLVRGIGEADVLPGEHARDRRERRGVGLGADGVGRLFEVHQTMDACVHTNDAGEQAHDRAHRREDAADVTEETTRPAPARNRRVYARSSARSKRAHGSRTLRSGPGALRTSRTFFSRSTGRNGFDRNGAESSTPTPPVGSLL